MKIINKYSIISILLLSFFCAFSQQKGINLINKQTKDTIFIEELRRIKIHTIDGKNRAGKFTIIDDKTIMIKNKSFSLDSIIKIRKASTFSAISSPISIIIGASFVTAGLVGAYIGGYGILITILLLPTGTPLFIVPFTANEHVSKKWEYKIKNK